MKKILSLSALALVLSGCSTGTGGGSKPVENNNELSAYVGTYSGENGNLTINKDGTITEGDKVHKPKEVRADNGYVYVVSDLEEKEQPILFRIVPEGTKGNFMNDTSKHRIEKEFKGWSQGYTLGGSTNNQTTTQTMTITTTTVATQGSKDSNGLSAYVGTYTGDNGSITLNSDGSITDGGQTHKATETSTENGVIHITSNLNVGGMPVVFHVYQDRIEKDSKGGLVVFRKGGSSAQPSQKPTTELQTIPGGGFGRESADTGVSLGTKTVLPGAGVVIRQSPTTDSRVLGNLKQGARVNIGESVTNGSGETWITILENGVAKGYIRSDLLG